MEDNVRINLSRDEAIVLFEFLSRFEELESLDIVDQSEERVLWNLQSTLEKDLAEPFSANYPELLEQARARLRDREFPPEVEGE